MLLKLLKKLDYRLPPALEIEYQDKTNELTNKALIIGMPLLSLGIWFFYFTHYRSAVPGRALLLVGVIQAILVSGMIVVFMKGRIRRLINYFTPILTLTYVYALMGIYVHTLPDTVRMIQTQNWWICVVFLLYGVERISPIFVVLSTGLPTILFYFLQSKVPQLGGTEAFQFNWQLVGAHAAGFYICVEHCVNARKRFLSEKNLEAKTKQSDELLHNVLPDVIVDELKKSTSTLAHSYKNVTVVFLDLVGFTRKSATMKPIRLVTLLDELFSRFDELAMRHGLEKIKTIGDAYMAATGCPKPDDRHAERMMDFALELESLMKLFNRDFSADFGIKVGIASGTVMGGVIGKKRISFDLWGDVVNLASRIESIAGNGEIVVSESTASLIKDYVRLSPGRVVDLKGKGPTTIYSVLPRGTSSRSLIDDVDRLAVSTTPSRDFEQDKKRPAA